MTDELPDLELERRRLVERVERDLRFRYTVLGAIVLAGSGAIATIYVKQFTNEAQTEFASAKAVHSQATEFLLETQKQAVNSLLQSQEASESISKLANQVETIQSQISIASGLAEQLHDAVKTVRDENLSISDSLGKEISSLRAVVNDIAGKQEENNRVMNDLKGIQDRIGATNDLIEKRRESQLFDEAEIEEVLRAIKGPPLE